MEVYSVTTNHDHLAVTPIGDRYYRLADPTRMTAHTSIGTFILDMKEGVITNFRSGGLGVDMFIDQIGDEDKSKIYLYHDLFYTPCAALNGEHPVSRKLADEFLRDGLAWAGMSKVKRNLVYGSVRLFGKSAYEEDDKLTLTNMELFTFQWLDLKE